jgi:hypothetical protein
VDILEAWAQLDIAEAVVILAVWDILDQPVMQQAQLVHRVIQVATEMPVLRVREDFQAAMAILAQLARRVIVDLLDHRAPLDLGEARGILAVSQDLGAMLAVLVLLAVLATLAISVVQVT